MASHLRQPRPPPPFIELLHLPGDLQSIPKCVKQFSCNKFDLPLLTNPSNLFGIAACCMKIFIARTHRKRLGAVVKSGGQSLTGSSSFTTTVYVSTTMIYDRNEIITSYITILHIRIYKTILIGAIE